MSVTVDQLEEWMKDPKAERYLEFKESKAGFSFEKLVKYCAALANEKGGKLIFGVTDKCPRRVVGSRAFRNLSEIELRLREELGFRVKVSEIPHADGRVLVFSCPPRARGMPIQYKGAYWMRLGESLVPMTPDQLKAIFAEDVPDYSAEICEDASLSDLDPRATQLFRQKWIQKSGNKALSKMSKEQILADAELVVDDKVTYAALILFGTHKALGKHLDQAEVILEYRVSEASIPHDSRREFREGFFLFMDALWDEVNNRNDVQHFREGLFMRDIATFNEDVVREAILNAVSHRDYRLGGSVFLRQFPRRLQIESPGGFPTGITAANILWQQSPRNRRIAEAFARCGLVERSGQGLDKMFTESIREGKPRPDFSGTDDYRVVVTLHGDIQDPRFLQFLERVGSETLSLFDTRHFLVLDLIHREEKVLDSLKDWLPKLAELGVIEVVGRGRGTRYILSRRFYKYIGEKGVYTRKKGLDRATNKEILLKHIRDNRREGSQLKELMQVLPMLNRGRIQTLLREMRAAKLVYCVGVTKAARWYPMPGAVGIAFGKNSSDA